MPYYLTNEQIQRMPVKPDKWRVIDNALPVGQVEDRVYSLSDGKRLHWQKFPDGSERIHVDIYDPDRTPLHTVLHVANETPFGTVVKIALLCVAIAGFVSSEKRSF